MDDHGGIVWTREKELGNWQVMGDRMRGDRRRTSSEIGIVLGILGFLLLLEADLNYVFSIITVILNNVSY